MLVKNITNMKTPKVIGIGEYRIMPGEEVEIHDELLYVNDIDRFGKVKGKQKLLPSVAAQVALNMLQITKTAPAPEPKEATNAEADTTVVADEDALDSVTEEEKKKAEAAAKRAATRAAKKAAEKAAKEAAAE